jgi:exopolyphosphatase/guanosine-5'-triphosphate,3'-diphosphate pyrophosphatase
VPVAAVDIGTNSIRFLVLADDGRQLVRRQVVTGLGRGAGSDGSLTPEAVDRTVAVLAEYAVEADRLGAGRVRAVATAAVRDAPNREELLAGAEAVLGVRPEVITGEREAELSYLGAVAALEVTGEPVVVDIGGGSTELVWWAGSRLVARSIDIGSVRLTESKLPDRPASFEQLEAALELVDGLLALVEDPPEGAELVGVGGTWTSLAAVALDLPDHRTARVHGAAIERQTIDRLVELFAALSVEQTAAQVPALDPARAPVILAGAVIARESMRRLLVPRAVVSECDLLDAIAQELLTG